MGFNPTVLIAVAVVGFSVVKAIFHILKEWERAVIFTLGRITNVKGPGLIAVLPFVQKVVRIDTRLVTLDIPAQDVITKDNVSVKVSAVLYYRVFDPIKVVSNVENYHYTTSQLAQTTLRSVCGQSELDGLLSNRNEINSKIQDIIDHQTEPLGVKVTAVEVKQIDLPHEMQRAMAKQAEAERERRAKIIQAEGEFQAAAKLTEAASIMAQEPSTIQLRYLETLKTIASEHNSTIVFPLPMDIINAFIKKLT